MNEKYDVVEDVSPSDVNPAGIAVTLNWDLVLYPVWSSDGGSLFVLLWKIGLFRLDLTAWELELVASWAIRPYGRPTVFGDSVAVPTLKASHWWERVPGGWRISGQAPDLSMFATTPEWLPPGCDEVPVIRRGEGGGNLQVEDRAGGVIRSIKPLDRDGTPLRQRLGYPTWWEPGESVLLMAGEAYPPSPWIVDLRTGRSRPFGLPGGGSLYRFSRAREQPMLVGFDRNPAALRRETPEVRLLAYQMESGKVLELGTLQPFEAFEDTVGMSPTGDRVACVGKDGRIHIIPVGPFSLSG